MKPLLDAVSEIVFLSSAEWRKIHDPNVLAIAVQIWLFGLDMGLKRRDR